MSSRRNGSVSRAAETASKTRLHMDRNPQLSRINDPSNPAGRRKEIDNVMKRARQASPGSWDRKLLEVEEKDPNRWRHTGYKQMYLNGSRSSSSRRSRSPSGRRSPGRRSPSGRRSPGRRSPGRRSPGRRSPSGRRSRSPVGRRSRSPVARRSRSPVPRRSRSPVGRGRRSPPHPRRSPPPRRSRSPRREPVRDPRTDPRRLAARQERRRESPQRRPMSPRRPPPSPRDSSGSGSSGSSCSDESCSVCSAKNKKTGPPAKPGASPGRKRPATRPPSPPPNAVKPTRELLKAREASKRSREEKVLDWQRGQLALGGVRVKRESGERSPAARVSPHAIARALAEAAPPAPVHNQTKLTLSERFGKMAQWSAARSARLENMRITRQEQTLHVHIEPTDREDPEPVLEAAAIGSYPEELLAAAPAGLPSWDDVRVRYDYYKKRGYLRGLTLGDYVKWEEWWYKYQEWLKRERAYERWADGEAPVRRERRRRGGRHRRS